MQKIETERTSFPNAVKIILDALKKGEGFSITHLAREANLNRRTVEKVLDLLEEIQNYFEERKLNVVQLQRTKMVQFTERSGLLSLPEELQKLIIKTAYFPSPSREEEILVYAFLKRAWSPESAIEMDPSILVEKLLKQGQFLENEDGKIYLSDEGQTVAKGALKIYPELQNVIGEHR